MMIAARALLTSLFLVMSIALSSTLANAKHIIVAYDVSGSMVRLRSETRMTSSDIARVNKYLEDLLFSRFPNEAYTYNDEIIKRYDGKYAGSPFYQSEDQFSYLAFHTRRDWKLRRGQAISRQQLQQFLPDPGNLRESFNGQDTYLSKAKIEIYDLYRQRKEEETYWILVSDEDEDISILEDKDPGTQKKLAAIDETYNEPRVFEVLVNHHVTIRVRKIEWHGEPPPTTVFVATSAKPTEQAKNIQFSKSTEGHFVSEELMVDTSNPNKGDFRMESISVAVVDGSNNRLPIKIEPIKLNSGAAPRRFKIILPEAKELLNPGNLLEVSAAYQYREDPQTSPSFQMNYALIIDTVYLALKGGTDPIEKLDFSKYQGRFVGEAISVESESPSREAFLLDRLGVHILSRDGEEIHSEEVPLNGYRLGDVFHIHLPTSNERLDWNGNQMELKLDYQYNGVSKSILIPIAYNLHSPFPWWIFLLLLGIAFIIAVVLLGFRLLNRTSKAKTMDIVLTQVTPDGAPVGNKSRSFTLREGDVVALDQGTEGEPSFDVGCRGSYLINSGGRVLLHQGNGEQPERSVTDGEVLQLDNDQGRSVYVRFELQESFDEEESISYDDEPEPSEEEAPGVSSTILNR